MFEVDVGHKSYNIFKNGNFLRKFSLYNIEVNIRLDAKSFSCALKIRNDFIYIFNIYFFNFEIEW